MFIHREGYNTLAYTFVGLVLLNGAAIALYSPALPFVAAFSVIFYLIILQFFRNPKRSTPQGDNIIIAPADGKVVVIERTKEDEYFKDDRIQISIFMSPFNVHVNRSPISGIIKYFKYHPGKYLVAWHPKSSTENERTTAVAEHKSGTQILYRQIAGALAKRIVWYINENDSVEMGKEYGFIKFGSRIDIFLPLDAKIKVNLNQKTTGGETVIAEL
jgi:phosphatidylserine decarboxylase